MAQLYSDVTRSVFRPITDKDCLVEAACTPHHLPEGFTQELFEWAMNKSIEAQRVKYSEKPQIAAALSAHALWDLQDRLQAQIEFSQPPLALYATHDTTIVR